MASPYRHHFGSFADRVWLNAAHQGPLPLVAAEAARDAVAWKVSPWELTGERFAGVPARLKRALGRLIGTPAGEIILTNGASYGIHLLANGIPLSAGDDVLLMGGDFPSNLLPWLSLRERGVTVRIERPADMVFDTAELAELIKPTTRVLCMSWVHSFSGYAADIEAIGALCRDRGVWFLVNATQALGTRPLEVNTAPVDAVVCSGWKWLCGPYATGFAWIRGELLAQLHYNQAYWLSMQTAADLGSGPPEPRLPTDLGARRYDIFGTANFFNFTAWTAAVELILEIGVDAVGSHDAELVDQLIAGLAGTEFIVTSPTDSRRRSTIVFVSHREPASNGTIVEALALSGVYPAYRNHRIRFAPHFYNNCGDIDRALAVLHRAAEGV
ncbi:MAG: aminotransferase class V-fold PLP-dependent enzyme [Proteobacteria bacterium]|nr:aminotransferase class V-fold PLP-dependent enzyme [Pseudomonadota bacterium]